MKLKVLAFSLMMMFAATASAQDDDVVFQDKDSVVRADNTSVDGITRYIVTHKNGDVRSFQDKKKAIKDAKGNDSE